MKKTYFSEISSDEIFSQDSNKNIHSDNTENNKNHKLKNINKNLSHQIENTPIPSDFGDNLDDGKLFEKYSILYLKNFIFKNSNYKYKENKNFDFFEYLELFSKLNYTKYQFELFQNIIGFNKNKINYARGEFDLIMNNIEGKYLNETLKKFKYSFYKCNKSKIEDNNNYNILFEISKDLFKQVFEKEKQKQFRKYKKILTLLNSSPILLELRKKLEFEEKNKIALVFLTNGNYSDFDLNTSLLGYNKDYKKDEDALNEMEKNYYIKKKNSLLDWFNSFGYAEFPILILFIPKFIENREFRPKYVRELEKQLKETQNELKDTQNELKKLKIEFENFKKDKNEK